MDGSRGEPIECCRGRRLTEEGVAVQDLGAVAEEGTKRGAAGELPSTKSMDELRGDPVKCYRGGRIMDREGTSYRRGWTERGPTAGEGSCHYRRGEPLWGAELLPLSERGATTDRMLPGREIDEGGGGRSGPGSRC